MRGFYRGMRRFLTALAALLVVAGVLYYIIFTLTGIASAIGERSKIQDRDELLQQTATILIPTLAAESQQLAQFSPPVTGESAEEGVIIEFEMETPDLSPPTLTASPETSSPVTEVAVVLTATPLLPTATSLPPSETITPTLIPPSETFTETAEPTATDTPTLTATSTQTASPTDLPLTNTPTEIAQLATLIPTNTERPTAILTNTPRPSRTPSNTPTDTLTPSNTPTPTQTFTPSATFTASFTPTNTATASATPTASSTYTASPIPSPTPSPYPIEGTYATPVTTPIINFPPRAPVVENDPNIVNIVLMGSDSRGENIGRTDVIIVVTVNKDLGTVAMWHIPRDLLVYIPGYTVDRMNRAYPVGREGGWPTGGAGMVKETILYNFGIPIDFYALINFSDFETIIEKMGGLEISVDCQIEDWALITPDLDPFVEESYERYTMRIGRQTLSPYYALWYARSRKGTGDDFDRGRRQIDILRAIFSQARDQGLITQLTELYPELLNIVDTDMTAEDMIGFLPLANSLDLSRIERYNGVMGVHFENFTTPDDGRFVLLPHYEEIFKLAQDFVTPPTGSRLERSDVTIEVYDVSAYGIGFDLVASDRLAWEGFFALPGGQVSGVQREETLIYDYTGETKGSALQRIMEVMRVGEASVVFEPDPNRTVDYRIEVGKAYNTCLLGSSADEIEAGPLLPTPDPTLAPTVDPNATPQTVG